MLQINLFTHWVTTLSIRLHYPRRFLANAPELNAASKRIKHLLPKSAGGSGAVLLPPACLLGLLLPVWCNGADFLRDCWSSAEVNADHLSRCGCHE
jgi:hypothetical protein